MQFKDILKMLREERNLTQKEVATGCDISATCVCQLETGQRNPTGSTLYTLADFFEVSTDYLLGRTDELGNIAFTAPTLPAREQQLLADFRSLAPALQEMLLATIETWKGSKANAGTGKRA